jgi:diamine N-acetyltransferase
MHPFRPATDADLDAILAMMRQYYAEDGYPFVESDARQAALALSREDRFGRLWVARVDGRAVGYLAVTLGFSLEFGGRDAFIDELYIDPCYRGRGLGRQVIAVAETYCRQNGVRALHLEVERHRAPALKLYRRAGFEDHDRYLMTKAIS